MMASETLLRHIHTSGVETSESRCIVSLVGELYDLWYVFLFFHTFFCRLTSPTSIFRFLL